MQTPKNATSNIEGKNDDERVENSTANELSNDAVEDDGTPVLDERDLEENNLNEDEADDIEWEDSEGD